MCFHDKVAMVTGGTGGIGMAIAKKLAQRGCHIAFNYHSNTQKAEELADEIRSSGGTIKGYQADISDFEQVRYMADEIKKDFGKVDFLVNNSGIARDVSLLMMKNKDWHDVIDINLNGVFNCTKSFLFGMLKAKKGRIINISSITGITGQRGQTNYAASKAGIIGFTKSLAREIAPMGMTANVVAPGFIETDMIETLGEEQKKAWLSQIPLGRFGADWEIAETVAFLLSDAAAYITGQVIIIDGGMAI